MVSFGHPLIAITVIVFTVVLFVVFGMYKMRSRRIFVSSNSKVLDSSNANIRIIQELPLAYRDIDLLRDTVVLSLTVEDGKEGVDYEIQRREMNFRQLQMVARFMKNGYIYSFTQVYEENGMLYLYDVENYHNYHMLVSRNYQGDKYIWPSYKFFRFGTQGRETETQIKLASEVSVPVNPKYHLLYEGKDYVCNFAYPSYTDYVGLCNATPVKYDYNTSILFKSNNVKYNVYKVTKFNGKMMDIEKIMDMDIVTIDKQYLYNVFDTYDEYVRLFQFDKENKKYIPIIWSVEELGTSVVNRLPLHKPYFFCNDTSTTEFRKLEDLLCIDRLHWVVQDNSTRRSYSYSKDGAVIKFIPKENKLICEDSGNEIIYAIPGYFDGNHSKIENSS